MPAVKPAGQTCSSSLPRGLQMRTETTGDSRHFDLAFPRVVLPREHLDLGEHDSFRPRTSGEFAAQQPWGRHGKVPASLGLHAWKQLTHCCFKNR